MGVTEKYDFGEEAHTTCCDLPHREGEARPVDCGIKVGEAVEGAWSEKKLVNTSTRKGAVALLNTSDHDLGTYTTYT